MKSHPDEPVDPDIDLARPSHRRERRTHPIAVVGAVGVGGVVGSLARYQLGLWWPHATGTVAWSTLVINVTGCLLIGVIVVLITERVAAHALVRPFLVTGILGGYTTFSAASLDVVQLAHAHRPVIAFGYLLMTVIAAVAAAGIGMFAARRMAGVG